jgi:hypothetical protein
MRFSRFGSKHLPQFLAMLDAAKGAFKPSWVSHMKKVFSQRGCRKCGLCAYAAMEGEELAAAFATRQEVEAFVLYFILVKNEFLGRGGWQQGGCPGGEAGAKERREIHPRGHLHWQANTEIL